MLSLFVINFIFLFSLFAYVQNFKFSLFYRAHALFFFNQFLAKENQIIEPVPNIKDLEVWVWEKVFASQTWFIIVPNIKTYQSLEL